MESELNYPPIFWGNEEMETEKNGRIDIGFSNHLAHHLYITWSSSSCLTAYTILFTQSFSLDFYEWIKQPGWGIIWYMVKSWHVMAEQGSGYCRLQYGCGPAQTTPLFFFFRLNEFTFPWFPQVPIYRANEREEEQLVGCGSGPCAKIHIWPCGFIATCVNWSSIMHHGCSMPLFKILKYNELASQQQLAAQAHVSSIMVQCDAVFTNLNTILVPYWCHPAHKSHLFHLHGAGLPLPNYFPLRPNSC